MFKRKERTEEDDACQESDGSNEPKPKRNRNALFAAIDEEQVEEAEEYSEEEIGGLDDDDEQIDEAAEESDDDGVGAFHYVKCLRIIRKVVEKEWGYVVLRIESALDLDPQDYEPPHEENVPHCESCHCYQSLVRTRGAVARVHTMKVKNDGTISTEISDVYMNSEGAFHVGGGGGGSFEPGYFDPAIRENKNVIGSMIRYLTDVWDLIWRNPKIRVKDMTKHDPGFLCSTGVGSIPPIPVELRDNECRFLALRCSMCQAPSHFVFEPSSQSPGLSSRRLR